MGDPSPKSISNDGAETAAPSEPGIPESAIVDSGGDHVICTRLRLAEIDSETTPLMNLARDCGTICQIVPPTQLQTDLRNEVEREQGKRCAQLYSESHEAVSALRIG